MAFTKDDVSPFRFVNGGQVQLSDAERQAVADEWNEREAAALTQYAESARLSTFDEATAADATMQEFKAMTAAQLDAWWDANVTTAAAVIAILKRIVKVIVRKLL